jgi:hypothetical protein
LAWPSGDAVRRALHPFFCFQSEPGHFVPRDRQATADARAWLRQVIALFAALVATGTEEAEEAVMASGVVPRCLRLFAQFPFNNLVHHQTALMISAAFVQGSQQFIVYLIRCARWCGREPTAVPASRINGRLSSWAHLPAGTPQRRQWCTAQHRHGALANPKP